MFAAMVMMVLTNNGVQVGYFSAVWLYAVCDGIIPAHSALVLSVLTA
jgi:hypothetical protein